MQAIPDTSPRVHLDLDTVDREQALPRATAAWAESTWRYHDVRVVRSPGGLLSCHTLDDGPRRADRTDMVSVLDQVCIDIPPSRWDEEVAYWRIVTGRQLELGLRPKFAFLGDPDPAGGLRVLLQRLDSGDHVSAHPDFAVADRPAETTRHRKLGAATIRAMQSWTVMCAPDGLTYCLTDRDPITGRVHR